jgi:hypothetical protein
MEEADRLQRSREQSYGKDVGHLRALVAQRQAQHPADAHRGGSTGVPGMNKRQLQDLRDQVATLWDTQDTRRVHIDVARARRQRDALLSVRLTALLREQGCGPEAVVRAPSLGPSASAPTLPARAVAPAPSGAARVAAPGASAAPLAKATAGGPGVLGRGATLAGGGPVAPAPLPKVVAGSVCAREAAPQGRR